MSRLKISCHDSFQVNVIVTYSFLMLRKISFIHFLELYICTYKPVNVTRMQLEKGKRHDMFAHGCLSVRLNTPTEHVPFHLHLAILYKYFTSNSCMIYFANLELIFFFEAQTCIMCFLPRRIFLP